MTGDDKAAIGQDLLRKLTGSITNAWVARFERHGRIVLLN